MPLLRLLMVMAIPYLMFIPLPPPRIAVPPVVVTDNDTE